MSRDHVIQEVDKTIIDIISTDGDVFIDDDIRTYQDKKRLYSLEKLIDVHKRVMYIRDQIQFAILLQMFLVSIVRLIKPDRVEKFNKTTSDGFIVKHKEFIEQVWYWVVYWNLWYCIKFIGGMLVALVQ